jgi:hypothetical protein
MFNTAREWSVYWAKLFLWTPSHPIYLRFIVIFSAKLSYIPEVVSSLQVLRLHVCTYFSSLFVVRLILDDLITVICNN